MEHENDGQDLTSADRRPCVAPVPGERPGEDLSPGVPERDASRRQLAREMFGEALAEVRLERREKGVRLDGWRHEAALRAIERALQNGRAAQPDSA